MHKTEYLYTLKPVRPAMLAGGMTEQEAASRQRHLDYIGGLAESGALILAGRTQAEPEHSLGLVVFHAEDEDTARRVMESDPAVAEGLMTAELFPFPVAFKGRLT